MNALQYTVTCTYIQPFRNVHGNAAGGREGRGRRGKGGGEGVWEMFSSAHWDQRVSAGMQAMARELLRQTAGLSQETSSWLA